MERKIFSKLRSGNSEIDNSKDVEEAGIPKGFNSSDIVSSLESANKEIKGTNTKLKDSSVSAGFSDDRIMSVHFKKMSLTTNPNCRTEYSSSSSGGITSISCAAETEVYNTYSSVSAYKSCQEVDSQAASSLTSSTTFSGSQISEGSGCSHIIALHSFSNNATAIDDPSLNKTLDTNAVDNCAVDDASSVHFSVKASMVQPVKGSNAHENQPEQKCHDGRLLENGGSIGGDYNSDNPSPELLMWLAQFQRWSHAESLVAVDRLIELCEPSQVRHIMKVIEPKFKQDFISLLPRELALSILSHLEPKDLMSAGQTCRNWRFHCNDNLLWKQACRKAQILTEPCSDHLKRGKVGNMPIASPWKAAYMIQHIIEMNWRSRPVCDPKILYGHGGLLITCLQVSGNQIITGSDDSTLKIWSAITGRCLRTLVGHTDAVWSLQVSGSTIVSGSTDCTLKVWDMETGTCIHTLHGHRSLVRCMHLHGNTVVSGSRDTTLRVWNIDVNSGICLNELVGHMAAVRCVQYDGKLIVSGACDYLFKIWHPERRECLHTLQGHQNVAYSMQFDGVHVVLGSLDATIRVWDVQTGVCKHILLGHGCLISWLELRKNILVSGCVDATVKAWDIITGKCLLTFSGPNKHQSAITCLQVNSRFVITASADGTVKLWDMNTGDFIRNLVTLDSAGSGGIVWSISASNTKLTCAVGSINRAEQTKLMLLDFDVEGVAT